VELPLSPVGKYASQPAIMLQEVHMVGTVTATSATGCGRDPSTPLQAQPHRPCSELGPAGLTRCSVGAVK
jgi:hypothetical protein